ncbi:MAG: hypothetical protein JW751_16215 [Polyangiaceae bacterium]|nr:hypothetical protein [Polyangiaceae bacterium]
MNAPVPPFDPLGLPVTSSFLYALSYLTLTLHFVAMQFTVGGAILMLLCWRRQPGIARFFGTGLPLGFSYLVTFGIPPLLFLQTVYGQFFYSSSVLVGAYWISVIPLVIVGYGASYWHRMNRDARPRHQDVVVAIIVAALLIVGFIFVNNLALSLRPDLWLRHYAAYPSGNTLTHGEPTLYARYLLFVVPALFTSGMALVLRASYLRHRAATTAARKEAETSHTVGLRAMVVATGLEAMAAGWFWIVIPDAIRGAFAEGGALSMLAVAGVLLGVGALLAAWQSRGRSGMGLAVLAAHLLVGAVACLVIVRDLLRQLYLEPYFEAAKTPVLPQWGMFAAFLTVMLIGVVFLAILTEQTIRGLVGAADGAGGANDGKPAGRPRPAPRRTRAGHRRPGQRPASLGKQ